MYELGDETLNFTEQKSWIRRVIIFLISGKPYVITRVSMDGDLIECKNPDVPWPWSWTSRYVLGEVPYCLDKNIIYPNFWKLKCHGIKFWFQHMLEEITERTK